MACAELRRTGLIRKACQPSASWGIQSKRFFDFADALTAPVIQGKCLHGCTPHGSQTFNSIVLEAEGGPTEAAASLHDQLLKDGAAVSDPFFRRTGGRAGPERGESARGDA